MKTCTETTAIEKLLLSLQEVQSQEETRRIMENLSTCIRDPRVFQEEPIVHYNTELHEQSIIIWDAFESVTNGMYNPEALHKLELIDDESPFYSWKILILAILAFYQGDRDNLFQLLKRIPPNTPPSRFRTILRCLEEKHAHECESNELLTLLEDDHDFIRCAVDELNDCLENNHAEAFLESTGFLVRDILSSHSHAARRIVLWSIQVSSQHGFDISGYIGRLTRLFGRKEALRLVAAALMPVEPEISLLFWLRYGIESVSRDSLSADEISALILIIADTYTKVREDNMLDELRGNSAYTSSLCSLVTKLGDETLRLSKITGQLPPDFVTLYLFSGISESSTSRTLDPYAWLKNVALFSRHIMHLNNEADIDINSERPVSGREDKHHPQALNHTGCKQLEFLFAEGSIHDH